MHIWGKLTNNKLKKFNLAGKQLYNLYLDLQYTKYEKKPRKEM